MPATRHVRGTNLCLIGVHPSRVPGEAILVTRARQSGQGRLGPGDPEHERDAGPRRAAGPGPAAAVPVTVTAGGRRRRRSERLAGQIVRTPCLRSRTLSEITGAELWLKFENLQYTASFKERGALNRLAQLTPEQAAAGVIAMSAGNHAQGVAYHARRLGIPATIVMPRHTPFVKVENTRRFGARVVLEGEGVEEAALHARDIAAARRPDLRPPVRRRGGDRGPGHAGAGDAGGGTRPRGAGGADRRRRPDRRDGHRGQGAASPGSRSSASRRRSTRRSTAACAGCRRWPAGPTIAEGIAVKEPGDLTCPIIERLVDDVLLVEEAAIEAAILQLLEIEKTVAEGAGAAGLAAVDEPSRALPRPPGRPRRCAAATSTAACSRP